MDSHRTAELGAADPEAGAKVYADDRAFVFHSWAAQSRHKPMVIAGATKTPRMTTSLSGSQLLLRGKIFAMR